MLTESASIILLLLSPESLYRTRFTERLLEVSDRTCSVAFCQHLSKI